MFPLSVIDDRARRLSLPYLLIGGHAVNVYAEPRATLDVDLLVQQEDKTRWVSMLSDEGFQLSRDGGNFLQFQPPYGTNWRLDLMLVNADTFQKLKADSREVSSLGLRIIVPSPLHLIALKLHAMVHGPTDRYEKDFVDIVGIARNEKLDPQSELLGDIFARFGTVEIYDRFKERLK